MVLYGTINTCFIINDLISFYITLEVIGIASFLLITYPRNNFSIWVGLRYLLISNTAMLFYLMGAILEYQAHHSFQFELLADSPPEAIRRNSRFCHTLWHRHQNRYISPNSPWFTH
jgi:multicomponent Na+:H+ antiporter subunit D